MSWRHIALPIWYLLSVGGLFTAHTLVQHQQTTLGVGVWLGVVIVCSSALFALELAGARRFGVGSEAAYLRAQSVRLVEGYSVRQRFGFLAQAVFCWFLFGIGTVVLAEWAGRSIGLSLRDGEAASSMVASWPPSARIVVAFVALDAWSYARHRTEHSRGERGLLWRLVHRWHHVPTELDLWTGMVVHPMEAILVFAVPCTLFAALGLERWELLFLFTLFLVITMPQHMNSGWTAGPLGVVIVGPEAHSRHHSQDRETRNANYADCLTLWDRVFGTYRRPPAGVYRGPFGPGHDV